MAVGNDEDHSDFKLSGSFKFENFGQTSWLSESESEVVSRVWLSATPWTVAYQAPPSMGFSRQEYWSGLPFPSPADLPNPGIEPGSPALQTENTVDSLSDMEES